MLILARGDPFPHGYRSVCALNMPYIEDQYGTGRTLGPC